MRSLGSLYPSADETQQDRLTETSLSQAEQLELHRYMKLNRLLDERMTSLFRRGKVVGGAYSSRGQEAVSVGSVYALEDRDYIGPMIRNLGSQLVRGLTPQEVMAHHFARATGPTGGKDNLPAGNLERGIVGTIAMLGALIPVMAGVALAGRMQGRDIVALTWIGDGGSSTGDFHEGLNFASVLEVPLVLIVENNGYAYSTPTERQTKVRDLAARAAGYGIPGSVIDGNDVLAVHAATKAAVDRARAGGGPTLIEAKTFRMKGHAEHDDASYVPKERFAEWEERDPITRFEAHLVAQGLAASEDFEAVERDIKAELDAAEDEALAAPLPEASDAVRGVYEPAPAEVAVEPSVALPAVDGEDAQ